MWKAPDRSVIRSQTLVFNSPPAQHLAQRRCCDTRQRDRGMQMNCAHMRLTSADTTQVFCLSSTQQSYSMLSTLWSGGTMVVQPRSSASRFWDVALRKRHVGPNDPILRESNSRRRDPPRSSFPILGLWSSHARGRKRLGVITFGWWGMTETITQGIVSIPTSSVPRTRPGIAGLRDQRPTTRRNSHRSR